LKATLRKAVIANKIFPVYAGSALKNKGVQLVLDAVVDYLPSPIDIPAMVVQIQRLTKKKFVLHQIVNLLQLLLSRLRQIHSSGKLFSFVFIPENLQQEVMFTISN